MKPRLTQAILTAAFAALALTACALTGCTGYSKATEKRAAYQSPTPAGQMIVHSLKHPSKEPLAQLGAYLDAASSAATVLQKTPGDAQARADYNFAVARIFETINDHNLEPWKALLLCPGQTREWHLTFKGDKRPEHNPAYFSLRAADRYKFKGKLVVQQAPKEGLGAPLIAVSKVPDATKIDPFAQGTHIYYGVTGLVEIKGNNCVVTAADPLAVETVSMGGHQYPLAADFTASTALALAELNPRKKELGNLFKPDEYAGKAKLARLEPYNPKKIPILMIHGLGDSQATWAPMVQSLRADPVIRQHYQIWIFRYATGYPYPASAALLRKKMDLINARYPDHKKIVVIGHSMGGMITRILMTDSGMKLWDATYDKPPAEMPFSPETRKIMTDALIFHHRPEISRVIFCSPSHRGADMATNFFGRMGAKMIGGPKKLLNGDDTPLALAKPGSTATQLKRMPNSIDFLNPENRFVKNLNQLPLTPGIPYHSILGDRGKGGNLDHTPPVSSDGIVPYWSSHLDGAQSEIIIPSGHWTNQHPQGIAEVDRILRLNVSKQ